jgi:hypothetical protein
MARMNSTRKQTRTERRTNGTEERSPRAYKEVFGVVGRGDQNFWTRIGVAFENSDGSLNLVLNFIPTDPETTIQIREPRPRDD